MAKHYTEVTAKVKLSAVGTAEYTCENCGTEVTFDIPFTEEFEASVQDAPYGGHHGAKIKANSKAYEKAKSKQREIESGFIEWTDYYRKPCPDCGYTQSWMAVSIRKAHRENALVISVASFFVWGILFGSLGVKGMWMLILIAVFMVATYFLVMYIYERNDSNKQFDNVERENWPQVTWSSMEISPTPEVFKSMLGIQQMLKKK